jgi:hypothetical protein
MSIQVKCPKGHELQVKEKYAGKSGLCPFCLSSLEVPAKLVKSESDAIPVLPPFYFEDSTLTV